MRRVVLLGWVLALVVGVDEASGQATGSITGTVTEASTSSPLVGATVSATGTQLNALTGAEGRFVIEDVPPGTYSVRVAMLGYGEQTRSIEVTAGDAASVSFQLETEALLLEGIVVVGYGTQERRDVTGSVGSVDVQEMKRIPTPNLVTAMKGRVAGVDIVHTGYAPGAGMQVRVRGTRSLSAENEPLYVVDGVPLAGGIEDFNPADIESIEILKDASATAVYGSRGANGVVLITTNQGSVGDTRISYSFRGGVSNVMNRVDLLDGAGFADYKRQAYWAAGLYECSTSAPCEKGDSVLFSADPAVWDALQNGRSTDWTDLMFRDGSEQLHQIGISGGDERTRFNVSGEFFDEVGVVRGQDYDRKSIRAGIEHRMDRLSIGATLYLSRSVQNESRGGGLVGEAHGLNPLAAPYDDEGNPIFKPDLDPLTHNPLFDAEHWIDERERTRAFGSIFAEYQLADWLSVQSRFGPDVSFERRGIFIGELTDSKQGVPGSAQASQEQDRNYSYTLSNTITADRAFGDAHRVQATLLYEIQEERFEEQLSGDVLQLPYEHQRFYNLGSASSYGVPGSELVETALQSYMGRVNYYFQDRYVVTLTGRYDGSSRLAPGNKYSFFPSVAVAWQLGREPFLASLMGGGPDGQASGFLSDLKLRASWGQVGNSAVEPYQTQGGLTRTQYVFGGDFAFGYRPSLIENPDLKWERTTQLDIGLDFGFFRNRITGSVDFYRANTDDLLMERQLPASSGYQSILENVGQTRNTGIEISLSTINLQTTSGFRWTTDLNLAHNKNEIVSLFGGTEDDIGNRWFIGQPVHDCTDDPDDDPLDVNGCRNAVFFDFEYDGIWQEDEAEQAATYGARPGMIRVKDQNNDGTINDDDRVLLGNTYPDWTGGLTNRFEFKNVDLSIFATARLGHDMYNGTGEIGVGRYNMSDVPYWTPETPNNPYPQPDKTDEGIAYHGTLWYEDASNIRIRNITLGYTLPASLTERWGVRVARIYGSLHDPFLFTDFQGYDPEGATNETIPSSRKFLLGANIEF